MIDSPIISPIAKNIIYAHHEKFDGTGYPRKLKGSKIPLEARIVALADVYDALRSSRSYKSAISHDESDSIIAKSAGSHFDPELVSVYKKLGHSFNDIYNRFID